MPNCVDWPNLCRYTTDTWERMDNYFGGYMCLGVFVFSIVFYWLAVNVLRKP